MSLEVDPNTLVSIDVAVNRIANALEKVVDRLEKEHKSDQTPDTIQQDESMGSCPDCESHEVIQRGRYPAAIYRCTKCGFTWANDLEAVFQE